MDYKPKWIYSPVRVRSTKLALIESNNICILQYCFFTITKSNDTNYDLSIGVGYTTRPKNHIDPD